MGNEMAVIGLTLDLARAMRAVRRLGARQLVWRLRGHVGGAVCTVPALRHATG